MRKFKIAIWVIIFGLLLLFMFQNQEYFQSKANLKINLMLVEPYHFPELTNAVIFLGCFVLGLLVAFFFGFVDKFKNKKVVKQLNSAINENKETIEKLEGELKSMKPVPAQPAAVEEPAEEAPPVTEETKSA